MSHSLSRAAPVRFLIGVTALWTMGRGISLVGWAPPPPLPPQPSPARPTAPLAQQAQRSSMAPTLLRMPTPMPSPLLAARKGAPRSFRLAAVTRYSAAMPMMAGGEAAPPESREEAHSDHLQMPEAAPTVAPSHHDKRLSGSAWIFLRGGGRASSLSPGGQIGGGQAGARLLYRIDPHLSAAARISAAIGGTRQTEAAVGLDWKPIAGLPVHLMAERRIAIDRGGRNAWTLGAAGGVDDVRIAPGWRLDAYGEAGVVGARRRDLYADGAARIARAIALGSGASIALGGGAWGAAQPGASRLDLGPSAVLRLPVAHHGVAIALDWRQRVAGTAKPGSGAALTVATDF